MRLQVLVDLADRLSGPANGVLRSLTGIERAANLADTAIERLQAGASIAAVGLALAAPLGLATAKAIEFESAFADVRKVVEFTPEMGPRVLQDQLVQLSRQIPRSAAELTQIAAAGGQAGIALDELVGFTADTAKTAVAFDIAAADAGDTLAQLRNIFRLAQPEVMRLADAVNHLSNNMASKAPDILEVLRRVGGAGQLVGLTGQQMAALGSAMLATGTAPQVVSTGLSALINRLANATEGSKDFTKGLESIGYTAEGIEKAIRTNAQGTILDFLRTVNNSKDPLKVLSQMFGMEYADDIARLTKGLPLVEQGFRLVGDSQVYAGSVGAEFANRSATTANQLQLLRNDLDAIGITVGQVFLPPLRAVVAHLRTGADAVLHFAQQFPVTTRAIGFSITLLALLIVAAGGAVTIIGALGFAASQASVGLLSLRQAVEAAILRAYDLAGALDRAIVRIRLLRGPIPAARVGILALAGAFRALTVAMLTNPVILAITSVLALAAAFAYAWSRIAAFRDQVRLALVPLAAGWDEFRNAVAGLARQFGPIGEFIAAALGRGHGALDALGYAFGFVLGFLLTFTIKVFARIGSGILQALTGTVNVVRGLLDVVVGLFTGNFEQARAGVERIMQGVIRAVSAPLALLGQSAVRWGENIMRGLAQGIEAGLVWVGRKISAGAETIKGWFTGLFRIESPSKVFAGYGLMLSLGLAQGIEAGMPQVADAIAGLDMRPQLELAQSAPLAPQPQTRQQAQRSAPQISINIEAINVGPGQSSRQVAEQFQPAIKEAVLLAIEELAIEEGYGQDS